MIPFSYLGTFLLVTPYILPFLFLRNLSPEPKIIIVIFMIFRFLGEGLFMAPSFLIELYAVGESPGLILNIYFVSFVSSIISFVIIAVIKVGSYQSKKTNQLGFIWHDRNLFNENIFLIIAVIFFLFYVLATNGEALTQPRLTYQSSRAGIGIFWSGFIVFSSMWYAVRVMNGANIFTSFFIYFIFCYFSASKGLVILATVPLLANPRMPLQKKIALMVLCSPLIIYIFLSLFGQFGAGREFDNTLASRSLSYLNQFNLSAKVYNDYLLGKIDHTFGEIYLSGFWSYIPRAIYPDKPFTYGPIFLNELYFPGLAAKGITPSFGMFTTNFVDFGWGGAFTALLSLDKIFMFTSIYIIARNNYRRLKLYAVAFSYLVVPGLIFGIPALMSLTIMYFLLKPRKNYIIKNL